MDQIICRECGKPIKKRKDLCVAHYAPLGFSIGPYHSICYANQLLTSQVVYRGFNLINSKSSNYELIFHFGVIVFLLFLLVTSILYDTDSNIPGIILGILVFSISPMIRLYSYIKYEKPLT